MKEVAEKVISDVEVEYLPHVMSDTESNVDWQASDCIKEILRGNFKVYEGQWPAITVKGVFIGLSNCHDLATAIYNKAKDKVENAAIKELQSRVNTLEEQLKQAYSRY
ncbi:hypothetical protein D3C85_1600880 [compost metagenome]